MISLRLTVLACVLFLIGIEAAAKPDPFGFPGSDANPGQFNWNGFPGSNANPGQFNWNGFPGSDANPGPWNWNGFPPSRGDYPWQRNWSNGSPLYNRNRGNKCPPGYKHGYGNLCYDKQGCQMGYKRQYNLISW